jgi:hypothetical protein
MRAALDESSKELGRYVPADQLRLRPVHAEIATLAGSSGST